MAEAAASSEDTDQEVAPFVAAPPLHPEEEAIWRRRAAEYNSAYPGPVHWRAALNVLAATGSLPLALREANISRAAFNKRRERYPEFADAVQQANEFFLHKTLEQTAVMRAVDGYLEPVFHDGAIVGYKRKFSDVLLVRLLEGNNPEKFKPKTEIDLNVNNVVVEGGLPEMPLTSEDVPPTIIDHEPAPPQQQQQLALPLTNE